MITKRLPGFCFVDPTNRETINIRFASVNVTAETRRIRAIWQPELVQDLQAFQNIDAEAELTALLTENLRNEIDQQILQDLHDNQRFYQQHNFNNVLNRWGRITQPMIGDYVGHRAPQDNQPPDFGNIILPISRRIAAQTVGLDLVAVQPLEPLELPRGLLEFLDHNQEDNFMALPNEEGWYTKGVFESLLIKIDMLPFRFLPRRKSRRRRI
jgi:hypothetical protein